MRIQGSSIAQVRRCIYTGHLCVRLANKKQKRLNPHHHHLIITIGLTSGSTQWALIGLDLDTGADRTLLQFYDYNWAHNALANPFYAGVEATGPNMMTIGSIGGVLHLSPENPTGPGSTAKKLANKLMENIRGMSSSSGNNEAVNVGSQQQQLRLLEDSSSAHKASKFNIADLHMGGLEGLFIGGLAVAVVLVLAQFVRRRRRMPASPTMPK